MNTKNVFTIPFSDPFARTLAEGLLERYGDTPESLSKVRILLPTMRSCRSLRDVFLDCTGGKSLLLPRIEALGDLDDDFLALGAGITAFQDREVLPPLKRKILLAAACKEKGIALSGRQDEFVSLVTTVDEVCRFLDDLEREQIPFQEVENILPEDFSEHWQISVDFLRQIQKVYCDLEQTGGFINPIRHRNEQLIALAEAWKKSPPVHPVIAAGSTGSTPATAALLTVIAELDQGAVVLSGLDTAMQKDRWDSIGETHPQFGMKKLLDALAYSREEVKLWRQPAILGKRDHLLSEIYVPAQWVNQWKAAPCVDIEMLANIHLIECQSTHKEVMTIAVLLREVLEEDGKTAALVTPDRNLARQVSAAMHRFGVMVDDSAGTSLASTQVGSFILQFLASMQSGASLLDILSFMKHPLFALKRSPLMCRKLSRTLEIDAIRGKRVRDWQAVVLQVRSLSEELQAFVLDMDRVHRLLQENMTVGIADYAKLLSVCIEGIQLCSSGLENAIWESQGGQEVWEWLQSLDPVLRECGGQESPGFTDLLKNLLSETIYRPRYGTHPRLHILSQMESRLLSYDRVILGGLNENQWPQGPKADPWLSRPMREQIGLSSPERRIGQSAHDFCQQFASGEIYLVRSEKQDGVPTIESRWITRLKTLLLAQGIDSSHLRKRSADIESWVSELDESKDIVPAEQPKPIPPLSARPRSLFVTSIQDMLKNPYKVYARKILKLKPLDALQEEIDGRLFGSVIHKILEVFIQLYPSEMPVNAKEELTRLGHLYLDPVVSGSTSSSFWWNRFEAIMNWLLEEEDKRRKDIIAVYAEQVGEWTFDAPSGSFTLHARADRIEENTDGSVTLIDYKTGESPKADDIISGKASQMTLEAIIASKGAFGSLKARSVQSLQYWELKNANTDSRIKTVENTIKSKLDMSTLFLQTEEGVRSLIAAYDNNLMPYAAKPELNPQFKKDEYQQLARTDEWSD